MSCLECNYSVLLVIIFVLESDDGIDTLLIFGLDIFYYTTFVGSTSVVVSFDAFKQPLIV